MDLLDASGVGQQPEIPAVYTQHGDNRLGTG
jgi:hypothetical protein